MTSLARETLSGAILPPAYSSQDYLTTQAPQQHQSREAFGGDSIGMAI